MYLLILKVTQAQQDNITHAYPHPLAQLAADMAKSVDPVETESFHPPVAEHARHLGIFCDLTMETNQGRPQGAFWGGEADLWPLVYRAPCPSSLNVSSRFMSPSALPRRRFLPPLPLFFTILAPTGRLR